MSARLRANVQKWLRALGTEAVPVEDPSASWHYVFDNPAGGNKLDVMAPREQADSLVVFARVGVERAQRDAFAKLSKERKAEFVYLLRRTLNTVDVDFQMEGVTGALDCPTAIVVSTVRYEDGLNLDQFSRSIGAVFKTVLNALWTVELYLVHGASAGGAALTATPGE